MLRKIALVMSLCWLIPVASLPPATAQDRSVREGEKKAKSKEDRQRRDKSLRALAEHLGVGTGASVADIGAGDGPDSWVFADIVGETGRVFAEEIEEGKVKSLKEAAEKRKLSRVQAVLGTPSDPRLPADTLDLAFMHFVYHHVSQPGEMLRGIWRALKPGGRLVIIDQRRGTLADWVSREERAKKHYWIAETTVVRDAREQGFAFVECAEQYWHAKDSFVLVFQRPVGLEAPDRDPALPSPLSAGVVPPLLPPAGQSYRRVAFVALGEGRKLIGPILETTGCAAIEIVLEEWATQKDERPPLPPDVDIPSVLTEKGNPQLDPGPLDAVFFLDSYHLLFHGPALLKQLRERLTASGRIIVLDRQASGTISRREASHRRMIAAETVKQEMDQAGFHLLEEGPSPTPDRFLLVFGKADAPAP